MRFQDLQHLKTSPAQAGWGNIGYTPKQGCCIPLFSIHTSTSCGIGEFLDLIPLISWCSEVGFQILQILPINDTGEDTSPYNSISSVALNPLHLSLSQLPHIAGLETLILGMQKLNNFSYVKYAQVKQAKWHFLRRYYDKVKSLGFNQDFFNFYDKENYWLRPYAIFRAIKNHLKGMPINNWPKTFTTLENIEHLEKKFEESTLFFAYLQYLCYQQMLQVKAHADAHQVLLKGDLPILISKDSCDVWYFRQYFSSSASVGAPPDLYNLEGQNWQLPVYNMQRLAQDDYVWWKVRLHYAEHFYSMYRLDHVVGFFRLWVIDAKGQGHFEPEDPPTYLQQGLNILTSLLQSSRMLPVGEDLGCIPDDVKQALKHLGICGTKIPRWERNWQKDGSFIPFDCYDPLSVTSLSTHDSDTLTSWWEHSPQEARQFAEFLGLPYSTRLSTEEQIFILKESNHTASIFHINLLNDYLAIYPPFTTANMRINIPGSLSKHNWTYKMKPSIETLITTTKFIELIQKTLS